MAYEALPDGYYRLTSRASGQALDVSGVSVNDGAAVIQWTSHGGTNQQWQLEPQGVAAAARQASAAGAGRDLGAELSLYPNPAREFITVSLAVEQAQTVRLEVLDALARRVSTSVQALSAGRHEVRLPLRELPNGLYFIRVQGGGQATSQRFMIDK